MRIPLNGSYFGGTQKGGNTRQEMRQGLTQLPTLVCKHQFSDRCYFRTSGGLFFGQREIHACSTRSLRSRPDFDAVRPNGERRLRFPEAFLLGKDVGQPQQVDIQRLPVPRDDLEGRGRNFSLL